MPFKLNKYIDETSRLLDPRTRELEPVQGDFSCAELAVRKIDTDQRTVEAIVSTGEVDRYQEIVEPSAFKKWLKHFAANPVMLAAHDHSAWSTGEPTVIGKWMDIRITDKGLVATGKFMADDELAERYWRRYRDGYMRAFSVGFIAHSWEMREFNLAEGVSKRLRVFTEAELLEISAVAVPANRGALAVAASALGKRAPGAPGSDTAGGAAGDSSGVDYTKLAAALIEGGLGEAVTKQINKDLTDPCGPVDSMLREAIAAVLAEGSSGHDHGPGTPAPGSKRGTDELTHELRQLLA